MIRTFKPENALAVVSLPLRPRFDLQHQPAHFFILGPTSVAMMNEAMADRMETNHRVNVIGAFVGKPINMVAFEVRPAIGTSKRRVLAAAFAATVCAIEDMCCHGCRALVDVSRTLSDVRVRVSSIDRASSDRFGIFELEEADLPVESVLLKSAAADEIENDLWNLRVCRSDHDLPVAVIKPLAVKPEFAVLLQEQQKRTIVPGVIADLMILVLPRVSSLSPLAVILIAAIRQKAVVIAVVVSVGIRNDHHRSFEAALADPLDPIAPEDLLDVLSAAKNSPNVIGPRHRSILLFLAMVVTAIPFNDLNGASR